MNPNIFAASIYSIDRSTLHIDDLVKNEHEIVGICDYNSLGGAYKFAKAAKKEKKKTVVGVHLVVKKDLIVTIHALNDEGWAQMCQIVSKKNIQDIFDVDLLGGENIFVTIDAASSLIDGFVNGQKSQINKIIEKTPHNRFAISLSRSKDGDEGYAIAERLTKMKIPIIAAPKVSYAAGLKEVFDAVADTDLLVSPVHPTLTEQEIEDLYQDLPGAVENLKRFSEITSNFTFKTYPPSLPHFLETFDEEGDLKFSAKKGLKKYLEKHPELDQQTYEDRLKYELEMITKLGFSGYFLIVADYIAYANSQEIPVGPGRGSGAGSLVAMSLGITTIDPIKYGLFFERFINPDRISPPDFDIDFCEQRREEVFRYIVQKYGIDYTCQIGTWTALQPAASWRKAARVKNIGMGLSNAIARVIPSELEGEKLSDAGLEKAIEDPQLKKLLAGNPEAKDAMDLAVKLQSMFSSKSQHAAGIIIADHKIAAQTPLYTNERNEIGIPISEFDMKGVEDQGLIKFDFLGLKTLTIINRACKLIERDKGIKISPWDLPEEDENVMAMISAGRTANIFQLESEGMTKAARDIEIDRFSDIIALVALYRPGPMDQIPIYAERKKNPSLVTYAHPALKESLEETYGIPVYQEQIMGIGRTIAGYTLGQADVLRRAMGKKIAEEMAALKEGFISGCVNNENISPRVTHEQASALFALIEKFASYGFNKAHAAAYARISFVTAYLKYYHFHHFTAAAMTQDGYGKRQDHISQTLAEMRSLKTPINYLEADINKSEKEFSVEAEEGFDASELTFDIRFGFVALKKLKKKFVDDIVQERNKNGPFLTASDFTSRLATELSKSDFEILVSSGAMDSLYPERNKYAVRAALHNIIQSIPQGKDKRINYFMEMSESNLVFAEPDLATTASYVTAQTVIYGFNMKNHPVDPYRILLKNHRITSLETAKKANQDMLVKTIAYLANVEDNGYENKGVLTDKMENGKIIRMNVVFDKSIMPPNRFEDGNKDGVFLFKIDKKGLVKSWKTTREIAEFSKITETSEEDEEALKNIEKKKIEGEKRLNDVINEPGTEYL